MDLYAAAITLLQVWGVPRDKVQTPQIYGKEREHFKAQTKINNLELPEEIRKGLESIFEWMTHNEAKEPIDKALSSMLELELTYQSQKLELSSKIESSITEARKAGETIKAQFKKFTLSLPNEIDSLKQEIQENLRGIEDNAFSVYEFSYTIDSQALQQCLTLDEAKIFITQQLDLLVSHIKKLDSFEPSEKTKFLKKLAKCHTLGGSGV
ncbi:hypothetical protein [Legionella gresilensis]|uniref:hypothetical protein n=1 Tax=Legionella gresilensis TaxID=91823 RepID=UPI00104133C2|nr:hypothetical protein [Legionella gresilensis]